MVATRSRPMAVAFATILVISALPLFTGSAVASHAILVGSGGFFKLEMQDPATLGYVDYPTDLRVIRPGDRLRLNVSVDVPQCQDSIGGNAHPISVSVTAQLGNKVLAADRTFPLEQQGQASTNWKNSTDFTVVGNFTGSNGIEGNARLTATITATCGTQLPGAHGAPAPANLETLEYRFDTRSPVLAEPTISPAFVTTTAKIDQQITFTAAVASETNPGTLTVDFTGIGAGTTPKPYPWTGGSHIITINESAPPTTPVVNGARVFPVIRAVDAYGNVAVSGTTDNTWGIMVDNHRPPTDLDFRIHSGTLELDTAGSRATLRWASTNPATDVQKAKVTVKVNGIEAAGSPFDITSAGGTLPLTIADPFSATIEASMTPIDSAGNTRPSIVLTPQFITGVDIQYGGTPAAPVAVGKSEIRNVYVNTTHTLAPEPTYLPPTAPVIYGQFLRELDATTREYWENGTPGSKRPTSQSQVNHFQPSSHIDTRLDPEPDQSPAEPITECDDNDATEPNTNTAFQPIISATGVTSTKGKYVFTNLSSSGASNSCTFRSFLGGSYQLHVTMSTPSGLKTNVIRRIFVDGDIPVVAPSTSRSYALGPGHNWSEVHGMDNNPFRVFFAAHDSRVETGISPPAIPPYTDSRLRNVTFELVDKDGSAVVRRTSASADDPATPCVNELLARVDIRVSETQTCAPSYFYDFRARDPNTAPADACVAVNDFSADCIWFRVRGNNNHSMSWLNHTNFSGWVNVTFPDLPLGEHKVRVLAYDRAGNLLSATYPSTETDLFRVAPAVRILSSATSPAVTADGKLEVVVGASARYPASQNLGATLRNKCAPDAPDICPAQRVRIYVSNDNTGAVNGALYQERLGEFAATDTDNTPVKGATGLYTNAQQGHLAFSNTGVPMRLFKYASASPPSLPSNISQTQPIYVRAEVVATDPAGNTVTRSTEWVLAASSTLPSLAINQPPVEWALNITTSDLDKQPPWNVTFDRKGQPGGVNLQYKLMRWKVDGSGLEDTPLKQVDSATLQTTPLNPNPEYVFNWTGRLLNGSAKLDPGAYQLRVCVYTGTIACGSTGSNELGSTWRNFTVLPAPSASDLVIPNVQNIRMINTAPGKFVVGQSFDYTFNVSQGDANITGMAFKLLRQDAPSGEPNTFTSNGDGGGTGGFTVSIFEPLPEPNARSATFNARVTLPPGLPDQNRLILETTVKYDVYPFALTNWSRSIELIHDKLPPAGTLHVDDTLDTIFVTGSHSPPKNREGTEFKPAFKGTITDPGAGVQLAEIRITDLNRSKELLFQSNSSGPGAIFMDIGSSDTWVSNVATANAPAFVTVTDQGNGQYKWSIPLLETGSLPKFIDFHADGTVNESNSTINLSHTYRVDMRFTDKLGQRSGIASMDVNFDARAPYLGYKGQLSVPSTTPSGLTAPKSTVNWRGTNDSLTITAHATDNHCLAAVRLVGNSSVNPTTIVKANMNPVGIVAADGSTTSIADATKVCPNGAKVRYTVDLAHVPHMTEDVGNYTYWFEAEDWSGKVSSVEPGHRFFKIEVLDNSPAVVRAVHIDPPTGQAGGRALIRAHVFENFALSHVTVEVRDHASNALLVKKNMTPVNGTGPGITVWKADTTDDLNLTLEVRDYLVVVTAYDVHWNRTQNPTCPMDVCQQIAPIYRVRDDGAPAVVLESPTTPVVSATPTIKFRALHKALETSQISVRATTDGNASNLTTVPASALNYSELKAPNGTRQGWTVTYTPTNLSDNQTLVVNVTATLGALFDGKEQSFRVDAAAPTATANVTGGTTLLGGKSWTTSATRVVLAANDTVSATTLHYSVNGNAAQTYSGEITPSGEGEWKLEYWASDAAGNIAAKQTLILHVDKAGPRISVQKHGDDLLLTVTDGSGVGLNESTVTVHFRYGAATTFNAQKAEKLTGASFGATLPGNATESGLAYYFTARDLLGNEGSNFSASQPYTIAQDSVTPTNLPPTIRITAPTAGAAVRDSVEIRWIAEDPEEAPLTISIALRQPDPGRFLVVAGENSGTYTLNTSDFDAGAYTIVVTANDGEHSESAQITFNVESGDAVQVRNIPPPTVQPNTQVGVAIAVDAPGKTVAQATYRLVKDGQVVTSGILAPSQGLFAAGFTPSEPGRYAVIVDVAYTDGTSEPSKQAATFTVPGTVAPPEEEGAAVLPMSLIVLLAVAALTVALAAYGAFGRWKK